MKTKLKKKELTIELFNSEEINKNDIVYAVVYLVHKYTITSFHEDFLEFITQKYSEYIFDILKLIPSDRPLIKEQLINFFGAISPQGVKILFEKFKDDDSFCKMVIKKIEYHKNAADHGLPA